MDVLITEVTPVDRDALPAEDNSSLPPIMMAAGVPCEPRWATTYGAANSPNGSVRSIVTFDDGTGEALFVGGDFTVVGGVPAASVAKWDGTTWSQLGAGLGGGFQQVFSMIAVSAPELGGPCLFVAGNVPSKNNIARWDGGTFPFGSGDLPYGLYVGGEFVLSLGGDKNVTRIVGCELPCATDLDGDGEVGAPDHATLLGAWGTCP